MNKISNLKYAPIKYKPLKNLSEDLIYHTKVDYFNSSKIDAFIMFNLKKSDRKAIMKCFPELIERDGRKNVPSLYISSLIATPMQSGLGTRMLDFAEYFSKKIGCNGYYHLEANSGYTPNSVPQIFYKKRGMNTKSPIVNQKLVFFICKNKNATYRDIPNIQMFYPPVKEKETFLEKIWRNFIFTLSKI